MMSGAYSQRYKGVTDHHVNELKERHQSERSQMLARARKVQLETNRRRRALVLKRKQEAQREEQRREEILAKRKQQIREATERFQRANSQYQTIDSIRYDANRDQHQPTPALEEALKLVRGSPGLRRSFSYDGIGNLSNNSKISSQPYSNYSQQQSERIQEHVRQVAARTELQNKSVRNLTNSRSLFEQQLEQHQNQLHEQHRVSLHHFNSAIHEELQSKTGDNEGKLQQSDSLSSIDSLEAEHEPLSQSDTTGFSHKQHNADLNREASSAYPYTASTALEFRNNLYHAKLSDVANSFSASRNSASASPSNVAIVQPNNAQQSSSHFRNTQNQTDYNSNSNIGPTSDSKAYGAKPIVTNDAEFLKSYISRAQNFTINPSINNVQAPSYYDNNYSSPLKKNYDINFLSGSVSQQTSELDKEVVKTRLKAWATPSPIDGGHAQTISVTDNAMITNTNPTGVKATATNQTVTVNVTNVTQSKPQVSVVSQVDSTLSASNSNRSPAQPRVSEPSNSRYLSGSYYTVKSYAEQSRSQTRPLVNSQSRPIISSHSSTYAPTAKAELVLEEGDSIEEEAEETHNKLPTQVVLKSPIKSILKKQSSNYSDRFGVRGSGYSASLAKQRSNQHGASPGGVTNNVSVRDSLEVARQQIDSRLEIQKPPKKSVRFADQLEEKPREEEKENRKEEEEEKPVVRRPPRPSSSKMSESSSSAKPALRTRASSAGTTRSGIPVSREGNSALKKPPPAPNNMKHSNAQPVIKEVKKGNGIGVFDANGLRLERTPTDDEINLLWDRVRDCLTRNSVVSEEAPSESQPTDSRSSVQVQPRTTESECPTPQNQTPVYINGNNSYSNRKKVTMEHLANYSAKKTNALQRQQKQNKLNQKAAPSPGGSSGIFTQPSSYIPQNFNKEVSDSMAAFLTAEMLSNHSATASQIYNEINVVQSREPVFTNAKQQPKGHSALSMEEQRLLQSLEKLNERLRMTEQTLNPTKIYVPRPPTQAPTHQSTQQNLNHRRCSGSQQMYVKNFR